MSDNKSTTIISQKLKPKIIPITILFVIVIFSIVIALNLTGSKEVATAEQVWDAIAQEGYLPVDATYLYEEDMSSLIQCIAFEKDDVYFNFYILEDSNCARGIYSEIHSHLYQKYHVPYRVEHHSKQANYRIYTIASKGRYSVDVRVGNTVVYAYCDDGNEEGIVNVMKEIGYFD